MTDNSRKRIGTLHRKMAMMILVGIVVGLIVAVLTNAGGKFVADALYFSDEKIQDRMQEYQVALRTYVAENDISSIDSAALNDWAESNGYVSLFVYKENKLILKTGSSEVSTVPTEPPTQRPEPENPRRDWDDNRHDDWPPDRNRPWEDDYEEEAQTQAVTEYVTTTVVYEVFTGDEDAIIYEEGSSASVLDNLLLTQEGGYFEVDFSDGVAVACIMDNSQSIAEDIILLASLILSFLTFALIVLAYNQKKVNDIVALSRTVRRIGDGDLDLPIDARGQDEIALLAEEVDNMRCAVVEKIENEKNALAAGHELVATMSHDIRTPLTTLMGYLEILQEHRFSDEELEKKYLSICHSKAQQLKNLSDRLFNYFVVFGQPMAPLSPESIDAQLFLSQVLGEQTQYLLEKGFSVQYTPFVGEVSVCLDAQEIYRVFDNVFTNIVRYADRSQTVFVHAFAQQDGLCVQIDNCIDENAAHSESTGFGLKICKRVLEQSGGSFAYEESNGSFSVRICLPVELKNNDNTEKRKKR